MTPPSRRDRFRPGYPSSRTCEPVPPRRRRSRPSSSQATAGEASTPAGRSSVQRPRFGGLLSLDWAKNRNLESSRSRLGSDSGREGGSSAGPDRPDRSGRDQEALFPLFGWDLFTTGVSRRAPHHGVTPVGAAIQMQRVEWRSLLRSSSHPARWYLDNSCQFPSNPSLRSASARA